LPLNYQIFARHFTNNENDYTDWFNVANNPQAILTFLTPESGTLSYLFPWIGSGAIYVPVTKSYVSYTIPSPGHPLPKAVSDVVFTNYSQIYDAVTRVLDVQFKVKMADCALPIHARFQY